MSDTNTVKRPAVCEDWHLTYLDKLRDSGRTNMFGAGPYLRDVDENLSKSQSYTILDYWMNTFTDRNPEEEE